MLPAAHHTDDTAIPHVVEPPLVQQWVHTMAASAHDEIVDADCLGWVAAHPWV
jgi:hypothetical protein